MQQLKRLSSRIRDLGQAEPEQVANFVLATFGVIAILVTLTAIVESYSNLVAFSLAHQIPDWHGRIAPLAVDSFIIMGEMMLFAGLLLHWRGKGYYVYAVFLALGGFALSVGGNIFRHVPLPVWTDRAVQAIWPITATAALTGCLIIIKRVMNDRAQPGARAVAAPVPAAVQAPPSAQAPSRELPITEESDDGTARAPGLTAASPATLIHLSEREIEVALSLRDRDPLPGEQKLMGESGLSRRRSRAVLDAVRAGRNGGHHGEQQRA